MAKDPESIVEKGPDIGEPTPAHRADPLEPVLTDDPQPMDGENGDKQE